MHKLSEAIYLRTRQLAEKNNLTMYKLSKRSGVPQCTLCKLYDTKSVGTLIIYGICEGLEITLKEFFDDPLFDRENITD